MKKPLKLSFIHIPKCGGTSINTAIRRSMGLNQLSLSYYKIKSAKTMKAATLSGRDTMELREEVLREKLWSNRFRFVTGHVRCTPQTLDKYETIWNFATLLRDPVERWYSQYYFNLTKKSNHTRTTLPLDQYVDSAIGISSGGMYVHFFTDYAEHDFAAAHVEQACRTLDRLKVVGILEELPLFVRDFRNQFGLELKIGEENKNVKKTPKEEVGAELKHRVLEICKPDIQIYNYAKSLIKP